MNYKTVLIRLLIIVLLCPFVYSQKNETMKFPDNIVGKRAAAFLNAMNSKGDDVLSEFVKNELSPNNDITPEERLKRFKGMREMLGGLTLKQVLKITNESIVFLTQNGQGNLVEVRVEIEPTAQNLIGNIGLERTSPKSTNAPQPKLSEKELIVEVEKYLNDLTAKNEFSGAVLIAKKDKLFLEKHLVWQVVSLMCRIAWTQNLTLVQSTKSLRRLL